MDVNFTLRACPICRKVSYFVIPSVIWYSTKEEKQEIVDSYKAKLRGGQKKHLKLQAEMVGKGFEPNLEIYCAFIDANAKQGYDELAGMLKKEMLETQMPKNQD